MPRESLWRWMWVATDYAWRAARLADALNAQFATDRWSWNGRWPVRDLVDAGEAGNPRWVSITPQGCIGWDPLHPTRWMHVGGVGFNPDATVDMAAMRVGWRLLWRDWRAAGIRHAWRTLRIFRATDDPPRLAQMLDAWIGTQLYLECDPIHDKTPR